MAHLLVIESWVREAGIELAMALSRSGHSYSFITRDAGQYANWTPKAEPLERPEHPLLAGAREVVTLDTNDRAALLRGIREMERTSHFDAALTICDYYLDTVAWVCEEVGLPTASSASLRAARHKHWMREACRRAGLLGPAFRTVTSAEEAVAWAREFGYPVVVKPVDLCAGESVQAAHDEATLCSALHDVVCRTHNERGQERQRVALLEEFLHGEEYSAETCTVHGKTTVVGVTERCAHGSLGLLEMGRMHPAALAPEEAAELAECAAQALAAVGLSHGLAHVELKRTPAGPRIIEINPRMGGGCLHDLVRLATSIDPFELLFDLALGREPSLERKDTGIVSAAVRFLLPPRGGEICAIEVSEELRRDPDVVHIRIDDVVGRQVREPQDGTDTIGHLVAVGRAGCSAREKAARALEKISVRVA